MLPLFFFCTHNHIATKWQHYCFAFQLALLILAGALHLPTSLYKGAVDAITHTTASPAPPLWQPGCTALQQQIWLQRLCLLFKLSLFPHVENAKCSHNRNDNYDEWESCTEDPGQFIHKLPLFSVWGSGFPFQQQGCLIRLRWHLPPL